MAGAAHRNATSGVECFSKLVSNVQNSKSTGTSGVEPGLRECCPETMRVILFSGDLTPNWERSWELRHFQSQSLNWNTLRAILYNSIWNSLTPPYLYPTIHHCTSPWRQPETIPINSMIVDCLNPVGDSSNWMYHPSNQSNQRIAGKIIQPMYTLHKTNISPPSWHFWVDDFPFPKVGYVSSQEGRSLFVKATNRFPFPPTGFLSHAAV